MSEMVERVADAMLVPYSEGRSMQEVARVAIAAMREPTKRMLVAGEAAVETCISYSSPSDDAYSEHVRPMEASAAAWSAMLDAALADETMIAKAVPRGSLK